MISAAFLLLAGLLLIFMEFYLPGGIMGTVGAMMVLMSIILFTVEANSLTFVLLFTLAAIAGVVLVIQLALKNIRKTGKDKSIYLDSDQEGYRASEYDTHLIGKSGKALVDMRPGGRILIEGKKYQALSISGYIPKDSEVEVISGEGESLIVKLIKRGSS